MIEQRKLAAIMFTDIVGYTALMASDENNAMRILSKQREVMLPVIKEFDGTLIKELGDGTLTSFFSSIQASKCAIKLQKALENIPEFKIRIGIHLGDVIFSDDDVFGDGVNVAARIEPLAESGGIAISNRVYEDIHNKPEFKTMYLGEKELKNVGRPIKVYALSDKEFTGKIEIKFRSKKREKSLIVLPFHDKSPDGDNQYFCDGLTEEIIMELTTIKDLLVISGNSAKKYKGTDKDIKEIAEEVNVKHVVNGSIWKAGEALKINAHMIDAESDSHIWADKFSGKTDDIFDIQEKVSQSIVKSLQLKLSPEETKSISARSISDIKAYECYMRARQEFWKWTPDSFERAKQYLLNGLEIVGENEKLYYGLGYTYWMYHDQGINIKPEFLVKAEDYAKKVFEINPNSANGHLLYGLIKWKAKDTIVAYRHLKKSLKLDPLNPDTLTWLTVMLAHMFGKQEEMVELAARLLEMDPLTPVNYACPGLFYWMNQQYDEALKYFGKWAALDPEQAAAVWYVAKIQAQSGDKEKAIETIEALEKRTPNDTYTLTSTYLKHSLNGNAEKAEQTMGPELLDMLWNDFYMPYFFAECFALQNKKEESLKWLEQAVRKGWINYPLISKNDPLLENIRGEEEFKKIVENIKFEWEHFEL